MCDLILYQLSTSSQKLPDTAIAKPVPPSPPTSASIAFSPAAPKKDTGTCTTPAARILAGRCTDSGRNVAWDCGEFNQSALAPQFLASSNYARLAKKPQRSILFLAVTGEEKGLLGSDYFAEYPTVPRSQIAANVNMDSLNVLFDFRDVVMEGSEHSSLGKIAAEATSKMGLTVTPDPEPGINTRSPHLCVRPSSRSNIGPRWASL